MKHNRRTVRTKTILVIFSVLLVPFLRNAEGGTTVGKDGAAMVLVPQGNFMMGSPEKNKFLDFPAEETPRHKVYEDAFYIDTHEVTNRLFAEFLNGVKPEKETRMSWVVIRDDIGYEERTWPAEIVFVDGEYAPVKGFEDYPVIAVSWRSADAYCAWAGERLPTEAEWEKAARGGIKGALYPWGDSLPTGGVVFKRSWSDNYYPAPVGKVGSYHPNGYGIYDMAGNVWEWCSDWYDPNYYKVSPRKNPEGPPPTGLKALRGGSWANPGIMLRVAYRGVNHPDHFDSGVGFRCVKDAER